MITPRESRIIARVCELSTMVRECRKCGKVWQNGLHDCSCGGKSRVVNPAKVWRQIERRIKKGVSV